MGTLSILLFILGYFGIKAENSLLPKRPHIVFMLADDLGWNDVSFHGSKQIPTPNIDSLARDGIILNQYYVQPTCSPSRGSLMTGKYPIQFGFQHEPIMPSYPWGLPLKEKIIPQYLKELQYSTHAVGKWHLGFFKKEYLPTERGFDSFFGFYNAYEDHFTHVSKEFLVDDMEGLDLHYNEKNVWEYNGTYGSELFTEKARKVILEHDPHTPLFLYFAQQLPHSGNNINPLQAPENYVKPMVGIEDRKRKIYAGMISSLDQSVGDIFEALEISGMLDNTIFIFTTDNGGAPQEAQDGTSSSNWPLKGAKYTLWEGGIRGVSFIWSPILRNHRRIHGELMHITDWLPTILSAAGGPEAIDMLPSEIVGVDQWMSINQGLPSPRSEILLNIDDVEESVGIRKGRYKLVKGTHKNGMFDKWYDEEGKIFNGACSIQTQFLKDLYTENYMNFLSHSKAAEILWKKYGRDPNLAFSCQTPACKENLEITCGVPPPVPNCDAKKEFCLYDIISDPCEFYNIAKVLPNVTEEMIDSINKYRNILIPTEIHTVDPASNPKFHGNAWVPWK